MFNCPKRNESFRLSPCLFVAIALPFNVPDILSQGILEWIRMYLYLLSAGWQTFPSKRSQGMLHQGQAVSSACLRNIVVTSHIHNWGLPTWLASTSTDGTGQVVCFRIRVAHQPPRIMCSLQLLTHSTINQTKDHKSNDGQDRLHVLYQLTRGSEVPIPVLGSSKIVELLYPAWHQHLGLILTWTPEHHSGLTEQEILTRPWVGVRHKRPAAHIQLLWISEYRYPRHGQNCQMSLRGIFLITWDAPLLYAFSPSPLFSQCFTRHRWNELQSFS